MKYLNNSQNKKFVQKKIQNVQKCNKNKTKLITIF